MVLDVSLFNTQHYKVRIKKKKRSNAIIQLGRVAIENGAFGSLSTMGGQLIYMYVCMYVVAILIIQSKLIFRGIIN